MKYIIDEFDVNIYDAHLFDGESPQGTVRIALYGMTVDEDGNYDTFTHEPLSVDEVFDPEYLNLWDEDTWIYSHTIRDEDQGPVFTKIKKMHDNLVREMERVYA